MKFSVSVFLKRHLQSRTKANARYSQRAFARDLGLSPGRLSDILNEKIIIGPKVLDKICLRLKVSDMDRARLMKTHLTERSQRREQGDFQTILTEDKYALIAQPEHFNIMSLMETRDFKSDTGWIAKRLNIPVLRVEEAIRRLIDVGLLSWDPKGSLKAIDPGAASSDEIPSKVVRDSHRIVIKQAIECLDEVPLDKRDITSLTMAINMENIPKAKEMIRKFRAKMLRELQKGAKTEVYTINIQLFPNTVIS